jgi:hypothetical protein
MFEELVCLWLGLPRVVDVVDEEELVADEEADDFSGIIKLMLSTSCVL